MRIWYDNDDANEDVEDWQEADFRHASFMDAPTDILTGRTMQLDLAFNEARPCFDAWQETIRRT